MNPFTILDSILEDYAPPAVRRLIHALILLVLTVVAIWQGVEGDWKKFFAALGVALYAAANKANTDPDAGMVDGMGFYDGDDEGVSGNGPGTV